MPHPTFRNRPRRDFTIIRNTAIRDTSLSLKAKGMLALMLSFPDGWTYHLEHLERQSADGRDATRAAVRELEAAGYVTRQQGRAPDGRLAAAHYEVADTPGTVDGFSGDGLSGDGFSGDGKPAATKTYFQEDVLNENEPHQPPYPPTPSTAAPEEDEDRSIVTQALNSVDRRRARNYSTSLLAQQHPETHAALQDLQSVYAFEPPQYAIYAERLLGFAREHGGGTVAAACEAVLVSGERIKQPLTYIRRILENHAAEVARAGPTPGIPDFKADLESMFGAN